MKHKGSNFEYEDELCLELFKTFREVFSAQGAKVYEQTVAKPSPRWWVTPTRATIVIREMLKGKSVDDMRTSKKEMYNALYKRVLELIEEGDERSIYEIVEYIVERPAPHFFISPKTAREKIIKGRRIWRQKHPLFVPTKL